MKVFLDIETIPQQPESEVKALIAETISAPAAMKKQETIDAWHAGEGKYAGEKIALIEEQYRKTALDGGKGEIFSIAWSVDGGDVNCEHRVLVDGELDEELVLGCFFGALQDSMKDDAVNPYFVGHNIQWDLKFIWQRAVILGIKPPCELPFGGRHKSNFYDNMQAWAGFGQRISQDNLCKALGIEGKPDDISGSNVWDYVKDMAYSKIANYNIDDVKTVIEIYNRINFIGAK